MAHAQTLVAELAKGPTRAYEGVKHLLYGATNTSLAEQMEFESEWLTDMAGTADVQEGIAAFLAKVTAAIQRLLGAKAWPQLRHQRQQTDPGFLDVCNTNVHIKSWVSRRIAKKY